MSDLPDTAALLTAAPAPVSTTRERKKRERKESSSTVMDIARLAANMGEVINRATENGGASARKDYETLSKALDGERSSHSETQKRLSAALDALGRAASANAKLEMMRGTMGIEMRRVEIQKEFYDKALGLVTPAIPALLKLVPGMPQSNLETAVDGNAQTGKAALIRLVVKIIEAPQVLAMVEEFAGAKDWSLVVQFAMEVSKQDAPRQQTTAA